MWQRLRKVAGWGGAQIAHAPTHKTEAPPASRVIDVTDENFAQVTQAEARLVVVDFWAEWCAPCTVMSAHVEWLAEEFDGQLCAMAVDADENPILTEQYGIMGLPTLLFLRGGAEIDRHVGVTEYTALAAQVTRLLDAAR